MRLNHLLKIILTIIIFLVMGLNSAHAQDITTGLVGHWKFDETSGTTATDSSGNGNTGTLTPPVGGPMWTTGKIGGAMSFDGVDDYILKSGPANNFTDFTFSTWLKTSSPAQAAGIIFGDKFANFSSGNKVGLAGGNFFARAGGTACTSVAVPTDNSWHLYTVIRDSSNNWTIYLDGSGTNCGTGPGSTTYEFNSIAANTQPDQFYLGLLDEVRIYNRALTASDIQALYALGSGSPPLSDTSAPTVSLTAPSYGATVSGSSVIISVNAGDNVGVSGVQFKLDGVNLQAEDVTSPYSITWNTTTASNGSHTLTATARDAAGNTTTSSGIPVTVNNTSPPPPSGSTALGNLAASMAPGTWAQLTGTNASLLSSQWSAGGHGFDDGNMVWNSKKRILMHTSADHGPYGDCSSFPNPPGICWKALSTYTDATNTWALGGAIPPTVTGYHGYDHVTWDDDNEVMYIRGFYSRRIYRYCVNNTPSWCTGNQGTWVLLPLIGGSAPAAQCCGGLAYHSAMDSGSLLFLDGESFGTNLAGLFQFQESTQTWTTIGGSGGTLPMGRYDNMMECSPVKAVCIFGGGDGSVAVYKIMADKTITAMSNAPYPITLGTTYARHVLHDPVSGDFIFFFGISSNGGVSTTDAELWKLNPDGSGTWTLLDGDLRASGKPCQTDFNKPCPSDFFSAPISTYGVLLFWKYTGITAAEVWLYKPMGNATIPPPDTTPPSAPTNFSASTISSSQINLSWTASTDNVGVTGYRVERCQGSSCTNFVQIGTPGTNSYSDNGLTANTTYRYQVRAVDAANNLSNYSSIASAATQSVPTGGSDFTARCGAAGVIRCIGFDQASDITNTLWGANTGIDTSGISAPVLDPSVKASGDSSMKFTIPSNSGSSSSGLYWANFSTDLTTQFGGDSEFYIQWRQRFSPEFLSTVYQGGGGWKQAIIGTGDKLGCTTSNSANCSSSCTALEVVTQNSYHRGFTQMYNSCTGSVSHGPYDGFEERFGSYDFKLQNARPSPYCLYSQSSSGYFPPNGNCFGYFSSEWMTFQVKIKTGPRVGDEFKNSFVELWIAREGQPSQMVINWGPYNLTAGSLGANDQFGKVWFLPYNTGKSSIQSHPTAYTWYDELIISRNKIADPGSGTLPTTLVGDLNQDRTVNGLDWTIMEGVWFTNDATADLNSDGIVNSIDFSLMNANWGKTN